MNIFIIAIINCNNKKYVDIIIEVIMDNILINHDNKNTTENYLFFSHQYRLKNYLINPLKDLIKNADKKIESGKFSNNMILCLTIKPVISSNTVTMNESNNNDDKVNIALNMIYGGDGEDNITNNKPDEEYWTTQGYEKVEINNKTYIKKTFPDNIIFDVEKKAFCNKFKIELNNFIINNEINLYFIRHGKAKHNEKNLGFFEKHNLLNPKLIINEETIFNMRQSAIKLIESIASKGHSVKAVFVSDLIRSQETAGFFLDAINLSVIPSVFVLPCLHENGSYDGDIHYNKLGKENQTDCVAYDDTIKRISGDDNVDVSSHTDCSKIKIKTTEGEQKIADINWSFYKTFYGEGYRFEYKPNRRQCRDTHFLGIFFEYRIKINRDIYTNTSGLNEYASNNNNDDVIYNNNNNNSNNSNSNKILLPPGYFQGNRGGKKRRQTKKQRVMKSKKVRRVKKSNKKSKKVKRRSNKRKA